MKKGTVDLPKMHQLAEFLNIPRPYAIGIMTLLWEYAARHTPRGDIGSVPNRVIAEKVEWPVKKADSLVKALVASRWVDEVPEARLAVHDWDEHCEFEVCRLLQRQGKDFLPHYPKRVSDRIGAKKSRDFSEELTGSVRRSNGSRVALAKALGSGKEVSPEVLVSREVSAGWWKQFSELWQTPCECCGLEFPWRDEALACQVWLSLVDHGEISEATISQVLDGLRRWRSSKDWHKDGGKWVFSVPAFLGLSKNGAPSAPRWNDKPQQKGAYD